MPNKNSEPKRGGKGDPKEKGSEHEYNREVPMPKVLMRNKVCSTQVRRDGNASNNIGNGGRYRGYGIAE
jgi:hypothetical protein